MAQMGPGALNIAQREVYRTFNFEIEFSLSAITQTKLRLAVDSAFLPSESNEEITLAYGNRNVYVAGKAAFETGSVSVKDFIGDDIEEIIEKWRSVVYNPATDSIGFSSAYKVDGSIYKCAPDGTKEAIWKLEGCWPTSVNYGSLDYNSSDIKKIEMTIRYDRAYMTSDA